MLTTYQYRNVILANQWIEKLIIQLNKDLELTGFKKQFDSSLTLASFQNEFLMYIETLLTENNPQLFNLLYRIDIEQNKIYNNDKKPQLLLTQLIIEREFQKVVLKSQFS